MYSYNDYLMHYGRLGMKWGVMNGPPYPIGDKPYSKDDSVFISGKVKYDSPLNKQMKIEVDKIVNAGSKILIGDAPGADTRVQDYLSDKGYKNVVVYTTDVEARNNVGNWKVVKIDASNFEDESTARRQKDIAMTNASTRGFGIMPENDRPDSAMSNNVNRLLDSNKFVKIFDYEQGKWVVPKKGETMSHSDSLLHWGILGQKWGVMNGPPYPLGKSQMSAKERRLNKRDSKWSKRNYNKIYKKAYKQSREEIKEAEKETDKEVRTKLTVDGKLTRTYMNAYNRRIAEIMNSKISDLQAPSGRVVRFVAKRGELGVHMALADRGYNMEQVKNGIYSSGKVAYKKKEVEIL